MLPAESGWRGAALVALALGLVACGRSMFFPHVDAPSAVVSPVTQNGSVGQPVTWRGSASRDPEGETLGFHWRVVARPAGSQAQLSGQGQVEATLVPDVAGTFSIELTVTAGTRTSQPALATLTVFSRNSNRPPTANAGPPRSGVVGLALPLDGSASSDPDGDPLTFEWLQAQGPLGGTVTISQPSTAAPTATVNLPGTYAVQLRVFDPAGLSATDTTWLYMVAATDAGSDAGSDAGQRDAGVDAGLVDAGRVDAGFDAGRVDGGIDAGVDAGAADAGQWTFAPDGGGPDQMDPGEVYLAGTLSPGACARDALAHWSTPNVASVGFDCYFNSDGAWIRPTDGRLLYTNTFEDKVREYHCDACTYGSSYPAGVLANDTIVPTNCPGTQGVARLRVSPEGQLLYTCSLGQSVWRNQAGAVLYDGSTDALIGVGAGGWILAFKQLVNTQTGAIVPITGLPTFASGILAARWVNPDHFLLALDESSVQRLYRVSINGTAQVVGNYPALPAGYSGPRSLRLDRAGTLFGMYWGTWDVIIRRAPGGTADIVYTEATNPLVKIHISGLVTGP